MTDAEVKTQTLFGFYGSLRKGEYNYMHLLKFQEGVVYKVTTTIPGYKLYSLGAYPAIRPSGDSRPLTIDIFEITNNKVKSRIDGMEIGAGYERKLVTVDGESVLIYVGGEHYDNWLSEDSLIPDGNWANRNNTRRILNETT